MAHINANFQKLQAGYLFPEIARRVAEFQEENPSAEVIKLGIGDTTQPLPQAVVRDIAKKAIDLGFKKTYTGYGDSQGEASLRHKIQTYYQNLGVTLEASDIFVSNGAKTDTSQIQQIFAEDSKVAVQDPAYPVYVDSSVMMGKTGEAGENGQYTGLSYLPATAEKGFLPELPSQKVDLVYLCFPNNPTGVMPTRDYLQEWVDWAISQQAVLIYDAAYSWFIQEDLPRSIYEIPGAQKCAIEIQSFSKFAGFTGVRLGWTVVPQELVIEDTQPGQVKSLWQRRQNTMFNGACNLSQAGGETVFTEEGWAQSQALIEYYLDNAKVIRETFESLGWKYYGGRNAPYIWLEVPTAETSWEFFDTLLRKYGIVTTPGSGFGPSGEGYIRFSAFGDREDITKAMQKIKG